MITLPGKSTNYLRVIFYVLFINFGISQLDLDLRPDSGKAPMLEMNQIPERPLDTSFEEITWEDQDLVNKFDLIPPGFQEVLNTNSLIIYHYKSLSYPVFSPPPETSLI